MKYYVALLAIVISVVIADPYGDGGQYHGSGGRHYGSWGGHHGGWDGHHGGWDGHHGGWGGHHGRWGGHHGGWGGHHDYDDEDHSEYGHGHGGGSDKFKSGHEYDGDYKSNAESSHKAKESIGGHESDYDGHGKVIGESSGGFKHDKEGTGHIKSIVSGGGHSGTASIHGGLSGGSSGVYKSGYGDTSAGIHEEKHGSFNHDQGGSDHFKSGAPTSGHGGVATIQGKLSGGSSGIYKSGYGDTSAGIHEEKLGIGSGSFKHDHGESGHYKSVAPASGHGGTASIYGELSGGSSGVYKSGHGDTGAGIHEEKHGFGSGSFEHDHGGSANIKSVAPASGNGGTANIHGGLNSGSSGVYKSGYGGTGSGIHEEKRGSFNHDQGGSGHFKIVAPASGHDGTASIHSGLSGGSSGVYKGDYGNARTGIHEEKRGFGSSSYNHDHEESGHIKNIGPASGHGGTASIHGELSGGSSAVYKSGFGNAGANIHEEEHGFGSGSFKHDHGGSGNIKSIAPASGHGGTASVQGELSGGNSGVYKSGETNDYKVGAGGLKENFGTGGEFKSNHENTDVAGSYRKSLEHTSSHRGGIGEQRIGSNSGPGGRDVYNGNSEFDIGHETGFDGVRKDPHGYKEESRHDDSHGGGLSSYDKNVGVGRVNGGGINSDHESRHGESDDGHKDHITLHNTHSSLKNVPGVAESGRDYESGIGGGEYKSNRDDGGYKQSTGFNINHGASIGGTGQFGGTGFVNNDGSRISGLNGERSFSQDSIKGQSIDFRTNLGRSHVTISDNGDFTRIQTGSVDTNGKLNTRV